ncbi:hypothetical protein ACFL48_05205 [Pseudomonadota bacterium]
MADERAHKNPSKLRWMKVGGVFVLLIAVGALWWHFTYTTSWKEEVLLHDGRKVIVERSYKQDPFARREIGQSAPRVEDVIRFAIPGTNQEIEWKNDWGAQLQSNLTLLMIDFQNDTPFIAAYPSSCPGYNKWGRPNPPYVFFKYTGKEWERVTLEDFPSEFKKANVMIGGYSEGMPKQSLYSIDDLNTNNKYYKDKMPELYKFVREAVTFGRANMAASCKEMVFYKCGWIGPDGELGKNHMDKFCD